MLVPLLRMLAAATPRITAEPADRGLSEPSPQGRDQKRAARYTRPPHPMLGPCPAMPTHARPPHPLVEHCRLPGVEVALQQGGFGKVHGALRLGALEPAEDEDRAPAVPRPAQPRL